MSKTEEIASNYFNLSIGSLIEGDLEYKTLDKDDTGYIVDIVEKINDLETGIGAKDIALSNVTQKEENVVESDITAELHTFKGIIYWYVTVPTLKTGDLETYIKNYYIEINALNGDLIM